MFIVILNGSNLRTERIFYGYTKDGAILALLQQIQAEQGEISKRVDLLSYGVGTANTELKALRSEVSKVRELVQVVAISAGQDCRKKNYVIPAKAEIQKARPRVL